MKVTSIALLAGLTLVACEPAPDDGRDHAAEAACQHAFNVFDDMNHGVLTIDEARTKFQEVHRTAKGSEDPELLAATEEVVKVMTKWTEGADVSDEEAQAVGQRIGAACKPHLEEANK